MNQLTRVKRKRGSYRAGVTRAVDEIKALLEAEDLQEGDMDRVNALRNIVQEKLANIKACDEALEDLLIEEEGEEYEDAMQEMFAYHEPFYELFIRIENLLSPTRRVSANASVSSAKSNNSADSLLDQSVENMHLHDRRDVYEEHSSFQQYASPSHPCERGNGRNSSSVVDVRLPPVDIESFDGDPLKYPSFINAFEGMIDMNSKLADVQKFYY